MATPCFYHRDLTEQDGLIELSKAESAHLSKSRRIEPGDQVNLINGQGLMAAAEVVTESAKQVQVHCCSFTQSAPRAYSISVATAVPKGDRSKVMVDMLTQLGVDRVIPMRCDYSVSRFRENQRDKWQRIAIEACKQSQNPWLPIIETQREFTAVLANLHGFAGEGFGGKNNSSQPQVLVNDSQPQVLVNDSQPQVLYAEASGVNSSTLAKAKRPLLVLIGPEGGFSESELAVLKSSNATALSLGDHILRTEAAAIAAMAQLTNATNR